ncbi:phosphate/phosphite/phosphonate ABC transporter substrate-binding protein [Thioalkalivibrio denitrificans]|nr:phosphate/phosphite/phosphonate ABC transporter substrate-binding protein [Thioalkalivibrio denitrificans]
MSPAAAKEREPALTLGILPVSSPLALFERFAPLRDFLGETLGLEVRLASARDFPSFIRNTAAGEYDIVLTAPHLVPGAVDSGHYTVRATFREEIRAAVLVRSEGPVNHLEELAGRPVAAPPQAAIVSMVGADMMLQSLSPGAVAPEFVHYPNHNAAVQAVALGFTDAAIVSLIIAQQAIDDGLPLERLATSRPIPGLGVLVSRRLPESVQAGVGETLIGMEASDQGRQVLKQILLQGFVAADPEVFEFLRPFAPQPVGGDG